MEAIRIVLGIRPKLTDRSGKDVVVSKTTGGEGSWLIQTSTGREIAKVGDYLVRDVDGNVFICSLEDYRQEILPKINQAKKESLIKKCLSELFEIAPELKDTMLGGKNVDAFLSDSYQKEKEPKDLEKENLEQILALVKKSQFLKGSFFHEVLLVMLSERFEKPEEIFNPATERLVGEMDLLDKALNTIAIRYADRCFDMMDYINSGEEEIDSIVSEEHLNAVDALLEDNLWRRFRECKIVGENAIKICKNGEVAFYCILDEAEETEQDDE